VVGWVDEYTSNLPDAMALVSAEFKKQGQSFEAFDKEYQLYRAKKEQVERDPDAPSGLGALLGKTLAAESLFEVRHVVRVDQGLSPLPKHELDSRSGEWITYLFKKLEDNATVRLMKDPIAALTPLFLSGLQQAIASLQVQSVLFVDTFEQTGEVFQPWLLDLLRGKYGDVPAEVQLCIAGRGELDRNSWSKFEIIMERIELAPFTPEETRTLLEQAGIKEPRVIGAVAHLSAGLPLLVAMLAVQRPTDPRMIDDPAGTAVSRFLQWIENPEQRSLVLDASLPRVLNTEILAKISNGRAVSLEWLRTMPFVRRSLGGWVYHSVVRQAMVREKRLESPTEWRRLQKELAQHYEGDLEAFVPDDDRNAGIVAWQNAALEAMYHRLCEASESVDAALSHFLRGLFISRPLAWRWVECIRQAGEDSQNPALLDWGRNLAVAMDDYEHASSDSVERLATCILDKHLDDHARAECLLWRGRARAIGNRLPDATADIQRAVGLRPNDPHALSLLGLTLALAASDGDRKSQQQGLDQAIEAFERALRLNSRHAATLHNLAIVLSDRGRLSDGALRQMYFDRAISVLKVSLELRPDHVPGMYNLAVMCIARATVSDENERPRWFSHALAQYEQILRSEATAPEILIEVGRLLSVWAVNLPVAGRQRWIALAIQVLKRALQTPTNSREYWIQLGSILVEVARRADRAERVALLDDAIHAYEQVTGTVADRLPALLNLGVALLDRGRIGGRDRTVEFCTRAIAAMEEHLLSHPQDPRVHSSLGLALFTRAGASSGPDAEAEYRQAAGEFRQALALNGRAPELYENSLLALSASSQPRTFQTSVSRRYAVCQILALVNDVDHCLDEIEKLADEDPTSRETIARDPVFQPFLHITASGTNVVAEHLPKTIH
jgi:tetratricopeptide (TPR) repeat protein